MDPGYATFSALLENTTPAEIDAVFVSHVHPDHCVDLNPLLRARVLPEEGVPLLPVYAPRGALDVVLALDRPGMLASGYTGDTGPSPEVGRLARDADLLLAEATYADEVPVDSRNHLSSAAVAGDHAAAANARRLLLVHLQPGTDPEAALAAARSRCDAEVMVAHPGLRLQV